MSSPKEAPESVWLPDAPILHDHVFRDVITRHPDAIGHPFIEFVRHDICEGLAKALRDLANAVDDVGVKHFDTDTMEPEVVTMQNATFNARAALARFEAKTGTCK